VKALHDPQLSEITFLTLTLFSRQQMLIDIAKGVAIIKYCVYSSEE